MNNPQVIVDEDLCMVMEEKPFLKICIAFVFAIMEKPQSSSEK